MEIGKTHYIIYPAKKKKLILLNLNKVNEYIISI